MHKFDKFAQEGNEFLHELATEIGHPEDLDKTMILLRSTLHTLRDSISIEESFHVIAQLPLVLKGIYTEHWKYSETPNRHTSMEQFKDSIKKEQELHGETEFNWSEGTDKLVIKTLEALNKKYLSKGQLEHVFDNLPKEVHQELEDITN